MSCQSRIITIAVIRYYYAIDAITDNVSYGGITFIHDWDYSIAHAFC